MQIIILALLCIAADLSYGSIRIIRKSPATINKKSPATINIAEIDDQYIEIYGNSTVPKGKIANIVRNAKGDISSALMNSGLFTKVEVKKVGNKISIKVHEEPVISELALKSQGIHLFETRPLFEAMKLKKGDILTRTKLKYAIEVLRQSCAFSTKVNNVKVNVKKSIQKNNRVNLLFEVKVHKPKRISRATFYGNRQLSSKELFRNMSRTSLPSYPIPVLTLKELNQFEYSEHKVSLEKYAKTKGFLDFEVFDVSIVDECFNIYVSEGVRYKIAKIDIVNDCSEISQNQINRFMNKIKTDTFYNEQKVKDLKQYIANNLFELGLNTYKVDYLVDKISQNEVHLKFKIYQDPTAFKVRSITVTNNNKYYESVIRERFKLKTGDYAHEDIIKMCENRVYDLDEITHVETKIKDSKDNLSKDLEISVAETKSKISLEFLWSSISNGLSGNLNTKNLGGTGISLVAQINSLDSVFLGFSVPNHNNGIIYSFKTIFGSENINSDFFETDGLIDFLHNAMYEYKYRSADEASQNFSKNIPQDPNLPRHSFNEFDSAKFAPNWYDNSRERIIKGAFLSIISSCLIPLNNNDRVGFGITLKNRSFQYPKNGFSFKEYRIEDPYNYNGDLPSGSELFQKALKEQQKAQKGKLIKWEHLSDEDKLELFNSSSDTKVDLQTMKSLSTYSQKKTAAKGQIERISQGIPQNRFLEPILQEKFEFTTSFEYKKRFLMEDSNRSSIDFLAKMSTTFGTTNSAKLWLMVDSNINLSYSWALELDLLLGIAANSHYLDNFKSKDLGVCSSMGPVEMYDFTNLGGKFMARGSAKLTYKIAIDSPLAFYPNIGLTVAGLSNSGYSPKRIPLNLAKKRGWPENSIDIVQNTFTPLFIFSPGIKMLAGPFVFGLKGNFKIYDKYPEYNILRPVDIEVGIKIGD